jgi:hypothetical protein
MLVMPANNCKAVVHFLAGRYPDLVGHLYTPSGFRGPYFWLSYAVDPETYAPWVKGEAWDPAPFEELLPKLERADIPPRWVIVPDRPGSRDDTLRMWDEWEPRLRRYGWPLALAIQDGMTPQDAANVGADVLFVGGTTDWKRDQLRHLHLWRRVCERIHVGRINGPRWLWLCAEQQVESCDGTGWFRGDPVQTAGLMEFLARYAAGERARSHGPLFAMDGAA